MSEEAVAAKPAASPATWQFSLRAMLKWVTIFCLLCVLAVTPVVLYFAMFIFAVAGTGALGLLIWKGKGWAQAFSIGAILPVAYSVFAMFDPDRPDDANMIFLALLAQLAAIASGTGAAACHGYLARSGGYLPIPDLPFMRDWLSNEPINDVTKTITKSD